MDGASSKQKDIRCRHAARGHQSTRCPGRASRAASRRAVAAASGRAGREPTWFRPGRCPAWPDAGV